MQHLDFPAKVLRGVLEVGLLSQMTNCVLYVLVCKVINSYCTVLLQAHLNSCPDKEKGAQERLVEPLLSLVKSYEGGRESHARVIVQALFEEYLSVEELFSDNIQVSLSR